jgi:hypothetical protein
MYRSGILKKLVEMCRAVSSEIFIKVKGKEVSDEFISQKGLMQGDTVALVLFDMALEM